MRRIDERTYVGPTAIIVYFLSVMIIAAAVDAIVGLLVKNMLVTAILFLGQVPVTGTLAAMIFVKVIPPPN